MTMQGDIWGLLGIGPTVDKKAIRSAYAAQSRLHHPEEEPEYFAKLNQAYRQALDHARTAGAGSIQEVGIDATYHHAHTAGAGYTDEGKGKGRTDWEDKSGEGNRREERSRKGGDDRGSRENGKSVEGREEILQPEETAEKKTARTGTGEEGESLLERLAGAQLQAVKKSMETGALHDFITLFTDARQAKVADTWRRFFLTEAFLEEQYAEEFAGGLYVYLMEQEVFPRDNLPAGLLQELAIAYALIPHFAGEEYGEGMKYPKEWYKVSVEQTFPARKQVAEIFNRQGWDCDLKSITRRMLKQPASKVRHNAFSDYLALKEMGSQGKLTEAEKESWQHILGLGQVHYLYERNGKRLGSGDYESRSECVVRLYVQWLKQFGEMSRGK